MYKAYNTAEAVKQVQIYLNRVTNDGNFIAPSGIYDDATKKSVIDFQTKMGLIPNGVVDIETLDVLYSEYITVNKKEEINRLGIEFPIQIGDYNEDINHINRALSTLLDHYGHFHRIRVNNYYSSETDKAVKLLSEIYKLDYKGYIDEIFYSLMIRDLNSP